MGKVNVYLPDDLEIAVRDAGLSVSPICQAALRDALALVASVRDGSRDPLTPRLLEVLDDTRQAGGVVTPYDLFGAIVRHGENLGARVLTTMGVELPQPQPRTKRRKANGAGDLDTDARALMARAAVVAIEMGHAHVGTEHVVVALAEPDSELADVFAALGCTPRAVRLQVERLIANPWATGHADEPSDEAAVLARLDAEVQRLAATLEDLRRGRA